VEQFSPDDVLHRLYNGLTDKGAAAWKAAVAVAEEAARPAVRAAAVPDVAGAAAISVGVLA